MIPVIILEKNGILFCYSQVFQKNMLWWMLLALLSHFATPQNSVAIRRSLTTKSLEIPDSSTAEKLKLEVWEGIKKPRRRDGVLPMAATLTETDDLRGVTKTCLHIRKGVYLS